MAGSVVKVIGVGGAEISAADMVIAAKNAGHDLKPFHKKAAELLCHYDGPARLMAHLLLVHDAAYRLLDRMSSAWAELKLNRELVLFGAAVHDIGKVVCTRELSKEGHEHELAGKELLLKLGIPEDMARFAATHALWSERSTTEELLVSLADKVWKGSRVQELEDLLVTRIAEVTGRERWDVFSALDSIIGDIAADEDWRLAWQKQFSV